MARIYTQPQFEGSFQSSAQSRGFAPEKAIDYSRQEKAKADAANEQEKVKARALARQANLDRGMLQGQQTIERAKMTAENSKQNASMSLLKGLAGLSSSAAGAALDLSKQAEDRQEAENKLAEEDSLIQWASGGTPSTQVDNLAEGAEQDQTVMSANQQGIGTVHNELVTEGDTNIAQDLARTSPYSVQGPSRRSVIQAQAMYPAWIQDKVRGLDTANMSDAEIDLAVSDLNRQFFSGVSATTREQKLQLAKTMKGYSANAYSSIYSARYSQKQAEAKFNEADDLASAATLYDPQASWQSAVDATSNSGANGTMGRTPINNRRALEGLLGQHSVNPVDGADRIRALMNTDKVPGQPQFGKLGDQPEYRALFDEAIVKAEKAAIADFSHENNVRTHEIAEISQNYLLNPTPENKAAATERLYAIGSSEAIAQAEQIMGNGLGINEQLEADVKRRQLEGNPYSQEELNQMVLSGQISGDTAKEGGASPSQAAGAEYAKDFKADIKSAVKGNVWKTDDSGKEIQVNPTTDQLRPVTAEAAMRAASLQNELGIELGKWMEKNPDKDPTQQATTILNNLLKKPEYKIKANAQNGIVGWWGESTRNSPAPTIVAGARNLSYNSPDQIRDFGSSGAPIDPERDVLIDQGDLQREALAAVQGKPPSARTAALADQLNMSSRELLESQLKGRALPSIEGMQGSRLNEIRQQRLESLRTSGGPSLQSSTREFLDYGVPPVAARQMAGLHSINMGGDSGGLRGMTPTQRQALNRIAGVESGSWGYDAMNEGGSAGGTKAYGSGAGVDKFGRPLTQMSVGEVLQEGREGDIWAAGKYQFIPSTLQERATRLNIPLDQPFDQATQDYITLDYMKDNPTAWIGVNTKDPGALSLIRQAAQQPLPPAPWANPSISPSELLGSMRRSNRQAYNIVMNPRSSSRQVQAALNSVYGRTAGRTAYVSQTQKVYTTGNLGYGSTGDHLDIKPVSPGMFRSNSNLPITRSELDRYVTVGNSQTPLSQALEVTTTDAGHRARGSHGIDFAGYQPNQEIYLTNGARVVENWIDPSANAEGSHRLLIEVPGGKRYAFLHGTSTIAPVN